MDCPRDFALHYNYNRERDREFVVGWTLSFQAPDVAQGISGLKAETGISRFRRIDKPFSLR